MKTNYLLILTFCMISLRLSSQTGSIIGAVYDLETQETLTGVTVILEGTEKGTSTDENGYFSIGNIEAGEYTLIFTYIGYGKKKLGNQVLRAGQTLDVGRIGLEVEAFSLKEITVTPGSFSILGNENISRQTLSSKDIENMSFAEDITRAVARLPGIASSDYSSKFTIRGGEADEVLITLDGMELYEPFHQRDFSGGLFSVVDIETVQNVELMTGGFSAEYGNRLSGAFNMKTKSVADNQKHSSIGLSLMNARVYTDGKFAKNKGSYMFSARRSMLDLVFQMLGKKEVIPTFYDVMGKGEYLLNDKHLLSIHVLNSGDKAEVRDYQGENFDKNDMYYHNTYTWLTLKSAYNRQLYSRTLFYWTLINQDRTGEFYKMEDIDKGEFHLTDKRDYTTYGVKQDWNWEPSNRLFLDFGFEAKQVEAKYDYFMEIDEIRIDSNEMLFQYYNRNEQHLDPSGQQVAAYLTSKVKVLDRLFLSAGLRYDYTSYSDDSNISPRLSLVYALGTKTFLRGAWGYYYQSQFINNLDVNNANIDFYTAELAKQYVLSFEHSFKNGINLRVEAYYKDLSNVNPKWQNLRDHLEVFPEQRNDYVRIVYNGTTSKGIEFFAKYDNGGKFSWWASYALAQADDDVKSLEFNGLLTRKYGKVPRLNDQRHSFYFDTNYRPNPRWSFHLSWQFYVGWPRTDYTFRYQTIEAPLQPAGELHFYPVHGEFNGTLYPAYHRMDIRANRHFTLRNNQRISVFLHLINIYNRENLKKFDLDTRFENGDLALDENGNYVPVYDNKYWFPFLPVFGASWEF